MAQDRSGSELEDRDGIQINGIPVIGSAMRYTNQYQNREWLYTVWWADDQSDHILVAVYPGVAWQDIAMRLTEDEVELLRRSEAEFTEFVKRFVSERETPSFKGRRIESTIKMQGSDAMICGE